MDELQIINTVVSDAVKNSSYTTVIISSSVFILYTIIIKIIDLYKTKDKSKPWLEMAAAVKEISNNVVKLNQVLDKVIQDADRKEYYRINNLVNVSFLSFKSTILDQCIDIIIHNNILENKETIIQNVYKIVNTEYYKLYSTFSAYEYKSINVATELKEEWIKNVTDECISIIYKDTDSLNRIRTISHKLSIILEEYSVYLKNKVLNH